MRTATLAAAAAIMVAGIGLSACSATTEGASPTSPDGQSSSATLPSAQPVHTLLVDESANSWPDVRVEGMLGLNDQGCITLDDLLLIAPSGSTLTTVSSGEPEISVPGFAALSIGDEMSASGITGSRDVAELDVDHLQGCLPPGTTSADFAWIGPGPP